MNVEPGWLTIIITVISLVIASGMYVIRAEVRKGNTAVNRNGAELVPNHGSSMRDAIDRIERRQAEDRELFLDRIDDVHDDIRDVQSRLNGHIDNHNKRGIGL